MFRQPISPLTRSRNEEPIKKGETKTFEFKRKVESTKDLQEGTIEIGINGNLRYTIILSSYDPIKRKYGRPVNGTWTRMPTRGSTCLDEIRGVVIDPRTNSLEVTFLDENGQVILRTPFVYPEAGQKYI